MLHLCWRNNFCPRGAKHVVRKHRLVLTVYWIIYFIKKHNGISTLNITFKGLKSIATLCEPSGITCCGNNLPKAPNRTDMIDHFIRYIQGYQHTQPYRFWWWQKHTHLHTITFHTTETVHHHHLALQPYVSLGLLCYSPPLVPILSFPSPSFNPHLS